MDRILDRLRQVQLSRAAWGAFAHQGDARGGGRRLGNEARHLVLPEMLPGCVVIRSFLLLALLWGALLMIPGMP